jgi:hypothetical protein
MYPDWGTNLKRAIMAQLLLISPALSHTGAYQQGLCKDGDLVGIFEDSHIFSELEHKEFEIVKVPGYTRAELKEGLRQLRPPEQKIYRKGNNWSFDDSAKDADEIKEAWQHTDGKWYFLEKPDKYGLSLDNLTAIDKEKLESGTTIEKQEAILKIRHRTDLKPENMTEVVIKKGVGGGN